jgi:hypothetical protein
MGATQGRLTNPAAGAVLADTGSLVATPGLTPQVVVSSSVTAALILQRRDAANAVTQVEQLLVVNANTTFAVHIKGYVQDIQDGERVRVVTNAQTNGMMQASLFW